eukprot:SAG22_NODE_6892_length_798_cov_1.324750_2_plen_44_part_00
MNVIKLPFAGVVLLWTVVLAVQLTRRGWVVERAPSHCALCKQV